MLRLILVLLGAAAYGGLAILGEGGFGNFFSHPPLIALFVVLLAMSAVALFAGGNLSSGVREDRANRWVIAVFAVVGLVDGYLPAFTDRLGLWTIDADTIRWLGVLLFAVGGTLRIWPVFVLGHRFSGLVAIQPGHALVTTGVYRFIRHPSYLGLLVTVIGWALAFRSAVGLLLAAIFVPTLLARIRAEERLLASQFGAEYDNYRARTSRLIPGIY
jgi:protein-S-isoprenylcysteine O-methyltransferase Ste14